jgi:hypothetical protein
MSRISLTKLILETSEGSRVELSLEEGRELFLQLQELFQKKEAKPYLIPYPVGPIIIDRFVPYRRYWDNDVWCDGSSDPKLPDVRFTTTSGLVLTATGENIENNP